MIQICVRPEDVKKVRGLVLSLAISGKLTSKEVSSEDISETFAIPSDWKWCTLSEIAACRGSAKAGSDGIKPSDWILDMEDIDGATGTVHTRATFRERSSLSTKSAFKPGDVLYGKLRPYLNKVVLADSPGFCTTEIIPITPGSAVESRYLQLALRSPYFLRYVAKRSYGMKMPRLGTKDLESSRIPLPPLAEQKRIVTKVDELMALCDRLEAQLKDRDVKQAALAKAALAKFTEDPTPENLQLLFHPSFSIEPKHLRKAVLSLSIKGKIVPQNSDEEPASQLIHRIASTLPNLKSKNPFLQKLTPSINDESLYPLPNGWAWLPLGHLGIWATGCGFPNQYQGNPSGDFLFCKVSDMNLGGNEVAINTTVHQIDAEVMETLRARPNPPGTIIFPKIGGAIATHKRRLVIKPTIIDNNCSGLQPIGLTDNSWLMLLLRSLDMTKYQTGTSVPAVSQGSLDPIRIGLPPLAEQRRIVERMRQLEGLIDQLEAQLEASRTTGEKLLEAMFAELTAA